MKSHRLQLSLYFKILYALLACLFVSIPGFAQGTGSLTGQISNASTRTFLQGALVEIVGTDRATVTDKEGRYEFTGLAPGSVTVEATFTGLDPQRIQLTVGGGQRVVRDIALTSEIYKLEKFTVAGLREGTALAATLQREAPNVKNIVSSDTFGNPADGNMGDFLVRLPGITANYTNGDIRTVSIRGASSELNSVTMDGQRVASAQSANTGRAFEFEQASMVNVESIEVTKAPTPDMDADSIGGSINLVTKSAFGRSGSFISYTLGAITPSRFKIYKDNKMIQPVRGVGPSLAMSYSGVVGEKRNLGIYLTGSYISKPGGEMLTNASFQSTPAVPKGQPPIAHPYMFSYTGPQEGGTAPQIRIAFGGKVDYKLSEATTLTFNASYNFFHEENDSHTFTLTTAQSLATFDAAGNRTGTGAILPGSDEFLTRVVAAPSSLTGTFASMSLSGNDKSGQTYVLAPSGRTRINGWDLDYMVSLSRAATYYDIDQKNNPNYHSNPKGTAAVRLNGIGFDLDRRTGDARTPMYRQTSGPDMYNLNNYTGMTLTQNDRRGWDTILGGKLNVKKDLGLAIPMFVKTGVSWRQQRRKLWSQNNIFNYTGPDRVLGTADDDRDLGQFLEVDGRHDREHGIYLQPAFPSQFKVARHAADHPEFWKLNVTTSETSLLQNRQYASETVGAGYVETNVKLGRLSVLPGVRWEKTKIKGEGPLQYISKEEAARRAAFVGPVTDDEARRRVDAEWGGRAKASGSYTNAFPGIHFKYEPLKGFLARASYSNGIGRPPFGNIIPLTQPNDTNQTVSVRNTALKPQYADNYDLSAEYYFEPAGLVSFGVYRKNLTNFIFSDNSQLVGAGPNNGFEGQYEGYRLSTQANGGTARLQGFEWNYQQQMRMKFLPTWLHPVGVYANYTYLKTEGDYGVSNTGANVSSELAGFVPRSANLGVSYIAHHWDVRVQAVNRGHYLTTNSTNVMLVRYQVSRTTLNVKLRYLFSQQFVLFLDVENILAEPYRKENYVSLNSNLPQATGNISPRWVFGLQGRFDVSRSR